MTLCGLLHSDICGSMSACDSPQLFAAYRVLLRLPMPRHSPCALCSLTSLILQLSLFLFVWILQHSTFLLSCSFLLPEFCFVRFLLLFLDS